MQSTPRSKAAISRQVRRSNITNSVIWLRARAKAGWSKSGRWCGEPFAAGPWDAPLDVERRSSAPAQLAKAIAQKVKAWIGAREGVWEDKKLRPMHAGDMMALVRTRGPLFRELIKAFKRVGLPVAGADRMTLKDELAVEDCLALIRVALDPA